VRESRTPGSARGGRGNPVPYRYNDPGVFAWEDKFRRLRLRFDRLSQLHYAFKTLAYTMINLRHYCQG
jgi:hypothetical protein